MADLKQELFDDSWNMVPGCTQKDEQGNRLACADGCHQATGLNRSRLKRVTGCEFNTPTFHPERLDAPLKWKPVKTEEDCYQCAGVGTYQYLYNPAVRAKCESCHGTGKRTRPRVIMVNIAGEGFDTAITKAQLSMILDRVRFCPQHTFLWPTKRYERAADILVEYAAIHGVLPNLILMPSICNQPMMDRATEPILRLCAAGWKVVPLLEPLLGPVDVGPVLPRETTTPFIEGLVDSVHHHPGIAGLVVGGQTRNGRIGAPCDNEWVRSLVQQADGAGIPVLVKQLHIGGKLSHDMAEWPEDLRRREVAWGITNAVQRP